MNEKSQTKFDNLVRDITKVGFMPKSEARRRLGEIIDAEVGQVLTELEEKIEDTIQEERFSGAPYALDKVISIIKELKR